MLAELLALVVYLCWLGLGLLALSGLVCFARSTWSYLRWRRDLARSLRTRGEAEHLTDWRP